MGDVVALVFGIIYLVIGVLGLIIAPGGGLLFGIFEVSPFHHLFHIVLGALGIFAGWRKIGQAYCQIAGIVLLLLGVSGFVIPALVALLFARPGANLLTDNLLHLVTGVGLAYFGFITRAEQANAS